MNERDSSALSGPSARRGPSKQRTFHYRVTATARKVESERFAAHDPNDTPTLYHYTDPKGLIGILSEGQLWATDIRYLNDSSELLHAEKIRQLVMADINEEYSEGSPPRRLAAEAAERDSLVSQILDTYVVCFSPADDLLTQWRTYGSHGSGFSIGFDRRRLQAMIQPPPVNLGDDWLKSAFPPKVHIVKVRYSEDEQKRELRRVFDSYSKLISATSPPQHVVSCARSMVNSLAGSASLFKHPCFESEAEWRIIVSTLPGASDLNFRPSNRTVVPFMKTTRAADGRLPVVSITIGPTLHQQLSRRSVQALLHAKKYSSDVRILRVPICEGFRFMPPSWFLRFWTDQACLG